jgi:glycosyltransferase involved in cell wall biosynthesis
MMLYRLLSRCSSHYKPYVISLSTIGEVGKRIQELGLSVEALGMKSGVLNPIAIIYLTQRLKKLHPDIVHTWMYHADLVGGLAAMFARVPKLTWAIRNSDLSVEKTKLATRAVAKTCALLSRYLPNKIISCSHKARDIHIAYGYDESRFSIIPNGFDLSCFRPDPTAYDKVREELGIPNDAPVIGLVGRFDPQKNHRGFFEAAGIMHDSRPDVHFVLAGKDIEPNNPAVATWVRNARIDNVTHLLCLRNDIPRLTAAFDVATSTSWGEAFPNVIAEAMACGVPCVVTNVGDSAYIVGDTGLVVDPGDMRGLVDSWEKLLSLLPDERRNLGLRARARVAVHFEIGNIVKRYEQFYDELVELGGFKRGTN